jgi:hypothetical protein
MAALSYRWFETIRQESRSSSVEETFSEGERSSLKRSLSLKPCEQPTKGNQVCLADL